MSFKAFTQSDNLAYNKMSGGCADLHELNPSLAISIFWSDISTAKHIRHDKQG